MSKQLQVTQIFSTYNYQRTQMKDFSISVRFFQFVIERVDFRHLHWSNF